MRRLIALLALSMVILVGACGSATDTASGGISGASAGESIELTGTGIPVEIYRALQASVEAMDVAGTASTASVTDDCRQAQITLAAGTLHLDRDAAAAQGTEWQYAFEYTQEMVRSLNQEFLACQRLDVDGVQAAMETANNFSIMLDSELRHVTGR